jgi:hypothetical protein
MAVLLYFVFQITVVIGVYTVKVKYSQVLKVYTVFTPQSLFIAEKIRHLCIIMKGSQVLI